MRCRHYIYVFSPLPLQSIPIYSFFFFLPLPIYTLSDGVLCVCLRQIAFRNNCHHMTMCVGESQKTKLLDFFLFYSFSSQRKIQHKRQMREKIERERERERKRERDNMSYNKQLAIEHISFVSSIVIQYQFSFSLVVDHNIINVKQ